MNAVEFLFALSAVTMMTVVIYFWTRFVYSLDEQDRNEPPERKTASASRTSAHADEHFAGLGVNAQQSVSEQNAALQ